MAPTITWLSHSPLSNCWRVSGFCYAAVLRRRNGCRSATWSSLHSPPCHARRGSIELAPKEFSILEYLMRNRGRPLSRTMIVEHVWDMDYDGLTNIVDVYIRHLRSKIDDKWPDQAVAYGSGNRIYARFSGNKA